MLVIVNQFIVIASEEISKSKDGDASINKCEYPSICQDCATQIENV